MKDRTAYFRAYSEANRDKRKSVKKAWRSVPANRKRESALDRLRYIRSKMDPSEGEIEQAWEIVRKFKTKGGF